MAPDEDIVIAHSADWKPGSWGQWPDFAHEYAALLEQAETALARRRDAYPAMVSKGAITGEDAQADIDAWEMLVAEWRWICTGEGEPPHPVTLRLRIAAVDLALERVTAELERGRRPESIVRQFHLITALRWHLDHLKFGAPAVHFWSELTRKCREDAAARAGKPSPHAEKETTARMPGKVGTGFPVRHPTTTEKAA